MINFSPRGTSEHSFERNPALMSLTYAQFLNLIDREFAQFIETKTAEYLHTSKEREGYDHVTEISKMQTWWQEALENKSLSQVVQEFGKYEFDESSSLSDLELMHILDQLQWIDELIGMVYQDHDFPDGFTRLEGLFCLAFGKEEGPIPHGGSGLIAFFFNYLRDSLLFTNFGYSLAVIERSKLQGISSDFCGQLELLIQLVGFSANEESHISKLNIMNICALNNDVNIQIQKKISFTQSCEKFIGELDEAYKAQDKLGTVDFNKEIFDFLKREFGDLIQEAVNPEAPRLIVIRDALDENHVLFKSVVPATNFYLTPMPFKPASPNDREYLNQINTKYIRDYSKLLTDSSSNSYRDISIFDPTAEKLFWGDLEPSDVSNLKGPLYILSQSDSYHQVPEWAKLKVKPVIPNEAQQNFSIQMLGEQAELADDKIILHIDYIRLKAMAVIIEGKLIENVRNI